MITKWYGKYVLWQQLLAVVLFGTLAGWTDASCAAEKQKASKKIYVSTIGLPFFPKDGFEALTDFVMYRVDSSDKSDRLLDWLYNRIESSTRNQKQFEFLEQVLSVRTYDRECVYLVFSPVAKGMKIEQPYRYAKGGELYFDAVVDTKSKDQEFLYLRVYIVNTKNDTLKKVINYAGKELVMTWQEP